MAVQRTLICLAAAALLMQLAMAANYTVGGPNGGWDLTTDLQNWPGSRTFFVGDILIFQYLPSHDVLEVSKADYDSCQTGNAIQTYNGGNTVIALASPGKKYFICGTMGHCGQGMKLEIDTLATSSPAPASPSIPTVPAASPSTPPSDSPVSTPPVSSPSPAQSPKTAPTLSPKSPSSSPSSGPPPSSDDIPSTELPTTAPPPDSSSATKGVSRTSVTMGFSLGMLMLLAF